MYKLGFYPKRKLQVRAKEIDAAGFFNLKIVV